VQLNSDALDAGVILSEAAFQAERRISRASGQMYKSYMDESGVQDTKAVVVAGYLGTDTQLDRLAREWEIVLSKPEYDMLEEGFHAREFYNPSPKSKVFQWRQTKRDQFVDDLLGVIEDRQFGFSELV
jgi:hypothetical protein